MCVHMWVGGQKLRERKRESRGGAGRQREMENRDAEAGESHICGLIFIVS